MWQQGVRETCLQVDERMAAYRHFFKGAYTSASLFDGHFVEAGASGCCAWSTMLMRFLKTAEPFPTPHKSSSTDAQSGERRG